MLLGVTALGALLVGLLAAGVAAWIAAIRDMILLDVAKRRWLRVPARLERIQPVGGERGSGGIRSIEVRYEYRVEGKLYRSAQLVPGWLSGMHYSSRTWVKTFERILNARGQLMIYCNPLKPWQSAVSLEVTEHVWFVFGVGVALLGLDILIAYLAA